MSVGVMEDYKLGALPGGCHVCHAASLSQALLLFNEEVKTPQNKGEYRNPN